MSESNEIKLRATLEDQFHADTGYDWNDPAGDDVRKVWLAGRASVVPSTETSGGQAPSGMVLAPHFRGYACLGAGAYVLSPCVEDGTPCLVIHIATEADKANREVGERRDTAEPGKLIQPEQIAVRLDFTSERGLFALEDMLAEIRRDHFATPQLVERKAQSVSDNGADALVLLNSMKGYREGYLAGAEGETDPMWTGGETNDPVAEMDEIMGVYSESMGITPGPVMARAVRRTKAMLLTWWGWHRETIRAALVESQSHGKSEAVALTGEQKSALFRGADRLEEYALELKASNRTSIAEGCNTSARVMKAMVEAAAPSNPSQSTGDSVRVEGEKS